MRRGATPGTFRTLILAALLAPAWIVAAQDRPPADPIPESADPAVADPAPEQAPSGQSAGDPPEENASPDPDSLPDAVVVLASGQKITGKLVEQSDKRVVLLVGNIRLDLAATQVDRVDVQPTVAQQYEVMRRTISPKDLPSRVLLAQWLFDKERYDWALTETEAVLDEDPANPEAQRLRRLVVSQLDLRARSGQPRANPRPPADRPPKFQFPLLTPEQINLIKVYEVDLADPPRMLVPRDAIDELIEKYSDSEHLPPTKEGRDALYHRSAADILELMFRMHARDLYGRVQVQDQPRSMEWFRDDVQQAWLINRCATDRCHGGAEAGRLRLYNKKPNSDATVYTDFLILDRFRLADGKPLIDYSEPARSPLLQMALPRENSLNPHPRVPDANGRGDVWQAPFSSPSDKRFTKALDWIRAIYQPRPDYPVIYEPPGPSEPQTNASAPAPPR